MTSFAALWLLNIAVIGVALWRRKIYSAEGYAFGYVLVSVVVDGIQLFYVSATAPETLLSAREFDIRLYPTVLHILGIAVFWAGLEIADVGGTPVVRPLLVREREAIGRISLAMIGTGLVLYAGAALFSGTGLSVTFVPEMDQLRSRITSYGGFWYRGAGVVLFGIALLIARPDVGLGKALGILAINSVLAMFFVGGKGSIASVVVFALFFSLVFNRPLFRTLTRPAVFLLLITFMYLGTGVKAIIASRGLVDMPTSLGEILTSGENAVQGRYSHEGLYRRYSSMIEYLNDHGFSYFEGYRVGIYTTTSWLPRLLYPNKPDHPYRGIDFMMNPDGITYMPDGNDATTLVGWGYVDGGIATLVPYLLLGGIVVGLIRRFALRSSANIHWRVGYIFFVLGGAVSSESGLLGLIDAGLFAAALMSVARVVSWITGDVTGVGAQRNDDLATGRVY